MQSKSTKNWSNTKEFYIIKLTFRLEQLDSFIVVACSGKEWLVPEL